MVDSIHSYAAQGLANEATSGEADWVMTFPISKTISREEQGRSGGTIRTQYSYELLWVQGSQLDTGRLHDCMFVKIFLGDIRIGFPHEGIGGSDGNPGF